MQFRMKDKEEKRAFWIIRSVHVRFHRVRIHEMYSCGVENARATVICLACTLRVAPKEASNVKREEETMDRDYGEKYNGQLSRTYEIRGEDRSPFSRDFTPNGTENSRLTGRDANRVDRRYFGDLEGWGGAEFLRLRSFLSNNRRNDNLWSSQYTGYLKVFKVEV